MKENIARRDPFSPLLAKEATGNGTPLNLPPGKPGLMIATLRVDGIVNGPNGMIAIVSNPQQRVYFLREGDHLYDGQVEHITMDGISFHQTGKDPFGNPVEREVTKRLNPTTRRTAMKTYWPALRPSGLFLAAAVLVPLWPARSRQSPRRQQPLRRQRSRRSGWTASASRRLCACKAMGR